MNDPLRSTEETEKFGFKVGDIVRISKGECFEDQIQEVVGFTSELVIVTVSGPAGEPDAEWWFSPDELELCLRA